MFPPCCLTWDQTMVEVMKIMATSFKSSQAHTATLSAPDPAACHFRSMPPPGTPGHSQASLGQSLVGSLLLSPGSWCTQGFVWALQESVSPVLCKFCNQIPLAPNVKFQVSCFKSWNVMLWKHCTQYASKFGKLSSGHRTGKGQFSFQSLRKALPENAQTTEQLCSSHTLAK